MTVSEECKLRYGGACIKIYAADMVTVRETMDCVAWCPLLGLPLNRFRRGDDAAQTRAAPSEEDILGRGAPSEDDVPAGGRVAAAARDRPAARAGSTDALQ